ncbi:hypothetical protein HYU19_00295 [Candidatus Woesearchaeota archaeon]|nr:hypothetical protein [Candidatus Woesearchaeota archaeon]
MEAIAKTRKMGGSLIVTIPKTIVEEEGLVENQAVKIDIERVRKSGFGLFKGTGSFDKESELGGQLEK